jgi:CDP-diglyceride synthetase
MIAWVGGTILSLGCLWALLSWMVPAYLLKPPPHDPDGELRLTMPEIKNWWVASLLAVLTLLVILVVGGLFISYIP